MEVKTFKDIEKESETINKEMENLMQSIGNKDLEEAFEDANNILNFFHSFSHIPLAQNLHSLGEFPLLPQDFPFLL